MKPRSVTLTEQQKTTALSVTLRTYNKYHLLIDEQQISDRTGNKLSEVQSFFCRTDQVNGCAHSSFTELASNLQSAIKSDY